MLQPTRRGVRRRVGARARVKPCLRLAVRMIDVKRSLFHVETIYLNRFPFAQYRCTPFHPNRTGLMQRQSIPCDAAARPLKLERLPSVIERIGLSRTTIWRQVKEGTFPAPVKLGPQAVAWPSAAIDEWIERKIRARGGSRD